MIDLATRALVAAVALTSLGGCYLSHGAPDGTRDAGRDAGRAVDSGSPEVRSDAGTGPCVAIQEVANVTLREGDLSSVTPRLVALPGGDVGLVHVSADGEGIRVRYHRFAPYLSGRGSTVIARDAASWAEPVIRDGALFVAYALADPRGRGVLQPVSLDGEPMGERVEMPMTNPSELHATRDGFFWLAFDMRSGNALVMAHLDPAGAPAHEPVRVELGRYGSGHGAVVRPDGRSAVLTYPREGPRGVRQGYVSAIGRDGALSPERQLSDEGDELVRPIRRGDELILVRHGDTLTLERTDFETLERLDRVSYPPRDARPFLVGALEGRALVAHVADGALQIDDFGEDLGEPERHVVRPRYRANGPSGSVLEVPGAIYFAVALIDGSRSFPFVVRMECVRE